MYEGVCYSISVSSRLSFSSMYVHIYVLFGICIIFYVLCIVCLFILEYIYCICMHIHCFHLCMLHIYVRMLYSLVYIYVCAYFIYFVLYCMFVCIRVYPFYLYAYNRIGMYLYCF